MTKRLLNLHTIQKIILILTTLLLLPTSAWGVNYQTTTLRNSGASGTQKYFWAVDGTSNEWTVVSGSTINTQSSGFNVTLNSANTTLEIKGMKRPVACKINKIKISTSYNTSNCSLALKIGNTSFESTSTTNDYVEFDLNKSVWDENSTISITYTRKSTSSDNVAITVNSITLQLCVDDTSTAFTWPSSLTDGTISTDNGTTLAVNAYCYEKFSFPLNMSAGGSASSASRKVNYTISNDEIASINENGEVTIKKTGNTTITATLQNNDDYYYTTTKQYSYNLNVGFPAPTISLTNGTQAFGSPITINFSGSSDISIKKYKWNDSEEVYVYNPENPPTVKAGTITAWAEISNSEGTISSPEVSATYVASYNIKVAGTEVTSNNATNILTEGGNNKKVSFNPETNTLTLNNAVLTDNIVCNTTDLFIDIKGTNSITTNGEPAISTDLEAASPKISIKSTSNPIGSLILKNTSQVNPCGGVVKGRISITTEDPISIVLPDQYNLTSDTTHMAVFGKSYNLMIGGVPVSNINASDILGDGKAAYNPEAKTLSLNGVTTSMIYCQAPQPLTIEINGSNTVGMIVGFGGDENPLTIKKSGSSVASLDVNTNGEPISDGMGPIFHFSSCTWGEGLYLVAYSNNASISGAYYYTGSETTRQFKHSTNSSIDRVIISTPSVWVGGTKVQDDGTFPNTNGILFDKETNTLTLSSNPTGSITSSLPQLKINIAGNNLFMNTNKIISVNPTASLSFEASSNKSSLSFSIDNARTNNTVPWEGFTGNPTFENKLVYLPNDGSQFIRVLEAPTILYRDGSLKFSGLGDTYGNYFDCHYTITYADGTTETGQNNEQSESLSVSKPQLTPCTVTAYTELDQFGKTTKSDNATAYYFGFADDLNVTFDGEEKEIQKNEFPALIPAVENIDFILSNSTNTNVIVNDDGHIKTKGLGTTDLVLNISNNENINVLNSGGGAVYLTANVIPSAPIFNLDEGTYDEAQSLVLTAPYKNNQDEHTNVRIKYYLGEESGYVQTFNDKIDINYSNKVTAWVEVEVTPETGGTPETFSSKTITKEYKIKREPYYNFFLAKDKDWKGLEDGETITSTYGSTKPAIYITDTSELMGSLVFTSSNENVVASNSISMTLDEEKEMMLLNYTIKAAGETTITASYTPVADEALFSKNLTFKLKVDPRDITGGSLTMSESSFIYTGSAIVPSTTVSLAASGTASAVTLTKDTDYSISCTNNTNVGTATITATGKGNYTGTLSSTFTIAKAAGGLAYSAATASAELNGDGWTAPELKNPNSLAVTYTSSNTAVATISETGVVKLVGTGETTIKAASEGDANHEACEVQYTLTVSRGRALGYGVWVGETEVDEDNYIDILNDGEKDDDGEYTKAPSFIFNPDENILLIINSDAGLTIESRMPELKIHLSNDNKLKKIFFNNQGNSENTGTLLFTCDSNFPGSVTIGNTVGESAISGFASVSYEFNLQVLKPAKAKYANGQMTDSLGVVADTITVGVPLEPIKSDDKEELNSDDFTVNNPDGSTAALDLTSANVNNIYYTLPESTEGQGYDPETNTISVVDPMTDDAVEQIAAATTSKTTTVGSSDYAENFVGLTFLVQGGEGVIRIDQETEEGYEFHLKIGDKPSIALKSGKEEIEYSLPDATYCWLYLVKSGPARARTRVSKRDRAPGNVRLVKVQSKVVASTKSAAAASGGTVTPTVNLAITGIVDIDKETPESKYTVETVNDKWFTIDGRRIDKPTQKGLYIRNRKKIVVK